MRFMSVRTAAEMLFYMKTATCTFTVSKKTIWFQKMMALFIKKNYFMKIL